MSASHLWNEAFHYSREGNIPALRKLLIGTKYWEEQIKFDLFAYAVRNRHTDTVRMLTQDFLVDSDSCLIEGKTPLWIAAVDGNTELLDILLKRHANANWRDCYGRSALLVAAALGHTNTVRMLLDHGVNPDTPDNDLDTPLSMAVHHGMLGVVRTLLENNANPNCSNENGETPVWIAANNGNLELVHTLLESNANPDIPNINGETPVWIAVHTGSIEVVRLLAKHGANTDAPDKRGRTPAVEAARAGRYDILWLLARECGADLLQQRPLLAFAMSQHRRLGAESRGIWLDDNVCRMIADLIRAPRASGSKYVQGHRSVPLLRWLEAIQDAPPTHAEENAKRRSTFKCAVCFSAKDKAVVLMPCTHRFCMGCWETWQRTASSNPTCPMCRATPLLVIPQDEFPDQKPLLDTTAS